MRDKRKTLGALFARGDRVQVHGDDAFVSVTCACGFRLARVPREVAAELPRCLGCGRARRVATSGLVDVRSLR